MGRQTAGGELSLEIPENLQLMGAEELEQAYPENGGKAWGVWDKENHVMITAVWKDNSALAALLADMKAAARKNQFQVSRMYAARGADYRLQDYLSLTAGGVKAEGYRFTYTADGVKHAADTLLVRHGRRVYALTCFGRAENGAADRALFRGVLDSLRFA